MIHQISISNFKAFGPEQHITLRPVTLIFGRNSGGKSSIIHSLLLAHHAHVKENWHVGNPKLSGESVDLGGFYNYVHCQEAKNEVSLKLECDVLPSARRHPMLAQAKRLRLSLHVSAKGNEVRGNDLERKLPKLMRCEVEIDGRLLLRLAREDETAENELRIQHWEHGHEVSQSYVRKCCEVASLPSVDDEAVTAAQKAMRECWSAADLGEVSFFPSRISFMHELPIYDTDLTPAWNTATDPLGRLSGLVRQQFPQYLAGLFVELHRCFSDHLNRIEYLGPLRTLPARFLPETDSNDPNWKSGGAFAWNQLMSDKKLCRRINKVLMDMKVPYDLQARRLADEDSVQKAMEKYLQDFFIPRTIQELADRENENDRTLAEEVKLTDEGYVEYLRSNSELHDELAKRLLEQSEQFSNLEDAKAAAINHRWDREPSFEEHWKDIQSIYPEGNPAIVAIQGELCETFVPADSTWGKIKTGLTDTRMELKLVDRRNGTLVTHRDVGIGISQVLPVLVHAVASENKLIAIEQPEIHLHPALQAELGDVFIKSALGANKNQFILETHSEHLILRILRRVRETNDGTLPDGLTPIRSEDVAVLFIEPGENGSNVIELPVTPDGDFAKPWPGGFFAERGRELF